MCCECKGPKSDFSLLKETLDTYAKVPGSLITILQKAQDIYGYLPKDVMYHIAEACGTTPAEVVGVATFYAQFRLTPIGKYLIMSCQGTACHVNGSERVSAAITAHLGIENGQTTADGLFTLEHVACLGCCSLAPVIMINGEAYGNLTPDSVVAVLDEYASQPGSLITILQQAQEIYGYLPKDVMYHIAEAVGVTPAEVVGVATFYSQFRLEPIGKYLIMSCQGTACHVNGSERISAAITQYLGIENGQTTADGLFTLEHVACLGCCSLAPVIMINGEAYGSLTPDKVVTILKEIQAKEGK